MLSEREKDLYGELTARKEVNRAVLQEGNNDGEDGIEYDLPEVEVEDGPEEFSSSNKSKPTPPKNEEDQEDIRSPDNITLKTFKSDPRDIEVITSTTTTPFDQNNLPEIQKAKSLDNKTAS